MDSPSLLAIHKEPIYPSVYHVFGGGQDLFLAIFFFDVFFVHLGHIFLLFGIILSMYQSFHICHLLFSTILEFLFDDKFDTGYLSASLNWLKFNVYISQFINF